MTRNIALIVVGLVILIVNLAMGEDGVISRVASGARYAPVAEGGPTPVAELGSSEPALPAPTSIEEFSAGPEPEVAGPLPESMAPRVE